MDTNRCAGCDSEVDSLATVCPTCGADPRTGQIEYTPPVLQRSEMPKSSTLTDVGLALAAAVGLFGFVPLVGLFTIYLEPAVIVLGIVDALRRLRHGRPTGPALGVIVLAAALLVAAFFWQRSLLANWD